MALLLGFSAEPAAASINVTTKTDEVQNNGQCSLREAITEANSTTPLGSCFDSRTNPNLINVPAGTYTLTRTGTNEDANSTGDLDVLTNMTIQGAGAATTTIDGNRSALTAATSDRVFDISGTSTVAINGVRITDGGAPTLGKVSPTEAASKPPRI